MSQAYSDQQLQAFLDEALPPELMSAIEVQMRSDKELQSRLLGVVGQREAGVHGLGEIWRRHRLSCPSRQQLGGYLLGTLDEGWSQYIKFHLEVVACRVCSANLEDLQSAVEAAQQHEAAQTQRRRKYFQSSAGLLRRESPE